MTEASSKPPPVPAGYVLTRLAERHPERPLITCGSETVTCAELESRANRVAHAYGSMGVQHGSYVTIALANSIEFYVAAFASWKLGAVPQPVSARLPRREFAAILELARPALVVGGPTGHDGPWTHLEAGFVPDPAVPATPIEPPRIAPAWKAPTSGGSTGRPKLIVSGQRGEVQLDDGHWWGMREGGVHLVPGPLYHNAPFVCSMLGLALGNHLVVLERFDADAALAAIEDHAVEWVSLVPTMMSRMARAIDDDPGRYDLGSLRRVWHMAAPCPAWLKERWIDLVGADRLYELYGGTEAQVVTTIDGREWHDHRGSVGRPANGEMRILGTDGEELPRGEVGEIFMLGRPDREPTYRYVGAEARVVDGWESIGDLGWMDDDGYLYLSDRRTDMIVSGGANIYPAEVEAALSAHPAVASCVVVGLPDDDLGARAHAVVQARSSVTTEDLVAFLGEQLVRYKVPRSFRFVEEALRDDAGKVRRTEVREREIDLLRS